MYEDLKEKEPRFPLERTAPGVSNLLWHQVREMERIISKIEKEDAVAIFYGKHDPLTLLEHCKNRINTTSGEGHSGQGIKSRKAAGSVASATRNETRAAAAGPATTAVGNVAISQGGQGEEARVTRGWLLPARKSPDGRRNSGRSSPPSSTQFENAIESQTPINTSQKEAGKEAEDIGRVFVAGRERQDCGSEGRGEKGWTGCEAAVEEKVLGRGGEVSSGRKRQRKGSGDATKTRRQSADEGQDRPPSPTVLVCMAMDVLATEPQHPAPLPPPPPPKQDHLDRAQERDPQQGQQRRPPQQPQQQSNDPLSSDRDSKALPLASLAPSSSHPPFAPLYSSLPAPPADAATRGPPINLTQLRERYVNGYYLPSLDTYLPQATPITDVTSAPAGGEETGAKGDAAEPATLEPLLPSKTKSLRGGGGTAKRGSRKRAAVGAEKKEAAERGAEKRPAAAEVACKKLAASRGANKRPAARGANKRPAVGTGKQPATAAGKSSLPAEADKKETSSAPFPAIEAPTPAGTAPGGVDRASAPTPPAETQLAIAPTREVKPLPDKHLPPAATLTFEYEPICDWDGLVEDIRGMVDRLVVAGGGLIAEGEGGEDVEGNRKNEGGQKGKSKVKGGTESGDELPDDDEARAGAEELVLGAKKWLKLAEDELKRATEKFERQVSLPLFSLTVCVNVCDTLCGVH